MMPKLPDFLDSRFNFYLNLLPLVNPLSFWSALLLGVSLLGYAITKATLQMSNYARKTTTISERKFARVNLIKNLSGGTPTQALGACEMKFINDRQGVKHKIRRSNNTDLKFQNLHRLSKLALEIEPALSDSEENNDEGRNCKTVYSNLSISSSCSTAELNNEVKALDSFEQEVCMQFF